MTFGPFILKNSYIVEDVFILELADEEGKILYKPKRFVVYRGQPFRGHQEVYNKAQRLKGQLVTTKTANPAKNSPEQWWIDINPHYASLPSTAVSASKEPTYTDEQQLCIGSFNCSGHLKISAFAGTGKTTTLLGIANSAKNKRGLYLAFNKEIADEASKKFPSNIKCRTTHSIAYEFCAKHYSKEKISGGTNAIRVAERLKLEPVSFGEHKDYSARQVGQWVVDTVKAFCQSDAQTIGKEHVTCGRLSQLKLKSDIDSFSDYLIQHANDIWQLARNPVSDVPLGHDGYLKLWSISHPRFDKDFIMLDEAQDTNAAVINALMGQNVKTVYVGDKYQQIYGFRGAFNAMDKIQVDRESSLTTSFRFGNDIAEIANAIIRRFNESRQIIGNTKVSSSVNRSQAKAYIYRTNIGLLDGLANQISLNKIPFISGGTGDLTALIHDVELMQSGQPAISESDFFGFKNWFDLVNYSCTDEGSSHRTKVQIIEKYNIQNLKRMIQQASAMQETADVVLTTAHKSKGKEWDHVEVCDDFATDSRVENLQMRSYSFDHPLVEEITLLYVALTRAKLTLNIPDRILSVLNLSKFIMDTSPNNFEHPYTDKASNTVFAHVMEEQLLKPDLPVQFRKINKS